MFAVVAQNARELITQYGEVVQVNLKEGKEIEAVFQGGQTATLGPICQFGYQGTGPTCFAVWLRAAGFDVTDEAVAAMTAPKTLRKQ